MHSGNGDRIEGRVPAWAQVDPALQAGAWLRGLCLRAHVPQPHCFHGNLNLLAGAEPHPHLTPTLTLGREHVLVIGKQVR